MPINLQKSVQKTSPFSYINILLTFIWPLDYTVLLYIITWATNDLNSHCFMNVLHAFVCILQHASHCCGLHGSVRPVSLSALCFSHPLLPWNYSQPSVRILKWTLCSFRHSSLVRWQEQLPKCQQSLRFACHLHGWPDWLPFVQVDRAAN